jgi:Xaa-Pro aminopeptidase
MNVIRDLAAGLLAADMDAMLITSDVSLAYITGMPGIEGVAFFTKDEKAYCFTDSRYIESARDIVTQRGFDVSTVEGNNYFRHINQLCELFNIKVLGFEDAYMTVSEHSRACEVFDPMLAAASFVLKNLRSHKTPVEAEYIKKAQRIAEEAFDTLLGEIRPGATENIYRARLEYLMTVKGSEMPAFNTILISGSKTSMPHGVPGDNIIQKGDFITFDFGATVNGYRSDMTRTVAVGQPTEEMKKVYDIVLNANLAAIEKANIGMPLKDVDAAARNVITKSGYGQYFGHSTGHGVGIEIHEAPSVSTRSKDNIENGHIITIEPGIYLPGKFGVRIEDMLYFHNGNKINLTEYTKNLIIL